MADSFTTIAARLPLSAKLVSASSARASWRKAVGEPTPRQSGRVEQVADVLTGHLDGRAALAVTARALRPGGEQEIGLQVTE
jgi:hypothetical protein